MKTVFAVRTMPGRSEQRIARQIHIHPAYGRLESSGLFRLPV